MASIDLSGGPQLLHVPDTGERYFVLQFVDAWTNNFAYVGTRATGNARGTYLLDAAGMDRVGAGGGHGHLASRRRWPASSGASAVTVLPTCRRSPSCSSSSR